MDNRGYNTTQPSKSYQSQGYQFQTQQRVTSSNGQQQYQYNYNAPIPEVAAGMQLSVNAGAAMGQNSNSLKAQFENSQQLNMQQQNRTAATSYNLLVVPVATVNTGLGSHADNRRGSHVGSTFEGSGAISVEGASNFGAAEHMNEDQYREWLTASFKHRFEQYEDAGGMPLNQFTEMANIVKFNRSRNLKGLFKRLDKDGNQRVSWDEFFSGMKYTKKSEVATTKRALNSFVESMTPAAKNKIKNEKQQAADEGEPIPEESYLEAYNCRPPPLFIPLFYVAVWVFFIIYAVEMNNGPAWNRVGWDVGFPYYSPLVFCPSIRQQVWRFVSYMFLHNGYHHIVFNTILSLLLGLPLESVHKAWRVGPVFIIGVIIGSFASSVSDPGTMLIGASGGVYALIGAHFALVLMNWEELQDDWLNMRSNPLKFLLSGVMRLIYLTLLIILDFGITFYSRYSGTQALPTSVAAHIGGLLAGFFSGVPILRNIDEKKWETKLAIVGWVVTAAMFVFGIFWNIFYPHFPTADTLICSNTNLARSFG